MTQYTDISSDITLYSSWNKSKKLNRIWDTRRSNVWKHWHKCMKTLKQMYGNTDTNHILRPKVGKRMHKATSQARSFPFVLLASTTVMTWRRRRRRRRRGGRIGRRERRGRRGGGRGRRRRERGRRGEEEEEDEEEKEEEKEEDEKEEEKKTKKRKRKKRRRRSRKKKEEDGTCFSSTYSCCCYARHSRRKAHSSSVKGPLFLFHYKTGTCLEIWVKKNLVSSFTTRQRILCAFTELHTATLASPYVACPRSSCSMFIRTLFHKF